MTKTNLPKERKLLECDTHTSTASAAEQELNLNRDKLPSGETFVHHVLKNFGPTQQNRVARKKIMD